MIESDTAVISGDGPLRSHNNADKVMSNIQDRKIEKSDWVIDLQKINAHKHSEMSIQLGVVRETLEILQP